MEVLNKLYRSKELTSILDGVGGVGWINYWYNYLYFDSKTFYLFSSIEVVTKSIKTPIKEFDDSKTVENYKILLTEARKGEYKRLDDNQFKYVLQVQLVDNNGNFIKVDRVYYVAFQNKGKILKLKGFNTNVPNEFIVEEEFEQIV